MNPLSVFLARLPSESAVSSMLVGACNANGMNFGCLEWGTDDSFVEKRTACANLSRIKVARPEESWAWREAGALAA